MKPKTRQDVLKLLDRAKRQGWTPAQTRRALRFLLVEAGEDLSTRGRLIR